MPTSADQTRFLTYLIVDLATMAFLQLLHGSAIGPTIAHLIAGAKTILALWFCLRSTGQTRAAWALWGVASLDILAWILAGFTSIFGVLWMWMT